MDRAPLADVALAEACSRSSAAGSPPSSSGRRPRACCAAARSPSRARSAARSSPSWRARSRDPARRHRLHRPARRRRDTRHDEGARDAVRRRVVDGGSYAIAGTPCEGVLRDGFRVVPQTRRRALPGDGTLRDNGIEGYAGYPLTDRAGANLGLVSIASRSAAAPLDRIESMMQIFAVRAAAEIERLRADERVRHRRKATGRSSRRSRTAS
jgi:GAF domain-containing protein